MAEELRLEDALQAVDLEWSNDRSATALAGMHRKRRRRTAARVGVAVAAVAMLVGGSYRALRGGADSGAESRAIADTKTPAPAPSPTVDSRAVVLADGSTITPAADAEPVEVVQDTADSSQVRLRKGTSTFKLAAASNGKLRVVSKGVRIAVYSAEFSASGSSDGVEVWVEKGHLEVTWSGGTKRVEAGERARFSTADADASGSAAPDDGADKPDKATKPKTAKRRKAADGTWRVLAKAGKYREAYEALEKTGNRAVRDQIGDLMLAADVARISGHPRQALEPLRRVIAKFPGDPRAPLAAFTQGRILLDKLGRASAAARAFAKARALAPRGALAEDALAREVESWARAGNKAKARARAQHYLKRYPNGHRARAMKNYAGP